MYCSFPRAVVSDVRWCTMAFWAWCIDGDFSKDSCLSFDFFGNYHGFVRCYSVWLFWCRNISLEICLTLLMLNYFIGNMFGSSDIWFLVLRLIWGAGFCGQEICWVWMAHGTLKDGMFFYWLCPGVASSTDICGESSRFYYFRCLWFWDIMYDDMP